MKKITTILICALVMGTALSLDAAPKKKVVKKRAKTTAVAPAKKLEMPTDRAADAAVKNAYTTNRSIDELLADAVGKEGTKQPIRNLLANPDFVERAGVKPLMEKFDGLSGSVYKFNHNGTEFYLVKFSNYLVDPTIEDVIVYVPCTDNMLRCRCKNSENMEILNAEQDFDITAQDIQKFYDSTFTM